MARERKKKVGARKKSTEEDGIRGVINRDRNSDKFTLFNDTLERANFWEALEKARKSARTSAANFRIIIKPDLEFYDSGTPTGTDPELVEYLILLLHRKGYKKVVVGDSPGSSDLWLENRDVAILAELAGYRYVTDDGKPYEFVDLSEDIVDVAFPQNSSLHGTGLARQWVNAHFRINMAKNKTHEENSYSLCVQNLLYVLPKRDKEYHYCHRLKAWDVCIDLIRQTPVHFNIVDAFISNHGSDGIRSANPIRTSTIIASENIILADWMAALKMGLDPYLSPLNAEALRTIGLPLRYRIIGDSAPYNGWINVPRLLTDSIRKRNRSDYINRMVRPWLQTVNRELFPFKNAIDDRINDFLAKFLTGTDRHPAALMFMVAVNHSLSGMNSMAGSWQTMYDKEKIRHKKVSLGFDPDKFKPSDYEAVVDYIQPLAEIAASAPLDRNGLRWRYIDDSVLFEVSRTLPVKFEEFISKVDISASVRMMNDYVGGACVPVRYDSSGRVVHQAERNIYLPQPNWMTIFGGSLIDVGKLQYIRYEKDCHKIFWRTVTSANDSATFDDGMVTFKKNDDGKTEINIVARQKFSLPLFWQVVNLDLVPQVKNVIVSDAYTTYFSRTIANFEAAFEGRNVHTGRSWEDDFAEPGTETEKTAPIEQISDVFVKIAGVIAPFINASPSDKTESNVDKNGFKHFAGKRHDTDKTSDDKLADVKQSIGAFVSDVFDAVKKDIASTGTTSSEKMQ